MFEYIQGILVESTPEKVVIDLHGLGYSLYIPLNNYPKLPQTGKEVRFFTSFIVREDAHTLFGFLTKSERELFQRLHQVSGIGPKTALGLVGHLEASDLQLAISQGNIALLCKVPGIGKKTAERLIVDLRDTLKKEPYLEKKGMDGAAADAVSALTHLGYHPLHAQKAIQTVLQSQTTPLDLPNLITHALKVFNG